MKRSEEDPEGCAVLSVKATPQLCWKQACPEDCLR